MKPRCQVLSRKWSKTNSFVREKIQYKKSVNNGEVQSKPIKKRGVYVEKKTSNSISSSLIQAGVKYRRVSGPSAEDKLNLIESALDVLSRMPVSLYPSPTKLPNLAAEGKHQLATPNISMRKEPQESSPVIVIQSQKNIPNPSSIYLSHQSSITAMERMETEPTKPLPSQPHHQPQPGKVTYPEMKNNRATETSKTKLTPNSEPKRNDTNKTHKSTIEKMIDNMALEDRMSDSAKDRSQSSLKKVPLTDGKPINTKTLVNKYKSSKKSNVSLYDFFVDLCKNKINYDPKSNVHGRKGHDDVSFSSVTDVDLAIVGNDIARPDMKLSPNSSESETAIKESREKPKPRLPPLRQNPALLNQRRNQTTMNLRRSEPYGRGPSGHAKIRQSMKKTDVTRCLCPSCLHGSNDVKDWLRVDRLYNLGGTWRQPGSKQPKQSFKYKKNALLSSLREQLTVSATDVTSEPQNLYQALQKVIRSQKKAEKYKIKERRGTSITWKEEDEDDERRSSRSGGGGRCLRRKTRNIKKIQVTPNDVEEPFRHVINSAYYDFY